MSDEQDRQQEQSGPEGSEGSITFGRNSRGDLLIDGVIVERGTGIGPEFPLDPPPASQEEMESLREENDALKEREELIAAHAHIIENPVFKDILNQYVEAGAVEAPRPTPPDPSDIVGYRKRMAEPESAAVLQVMREYAESLPEYQAAEINTNHRVFNKVYDRFKSEGAGNLPRPRTVLPASYPQDRRTLETIIRSKAVDRARVEPPGPAIEYGQDGEDDTRQARKAYEDARRRRDYARLHGTPTQIARAEQAMIESHPAFREKKTRRTSGGLEGY